MATPDTPFSVVGTIVPPDDAPTPEELLENGLPRFIVVHAYDAAALGSEPNNRAKTYYTAAKTDYGYAKSDYRDAVTLCQNIYKDEGIIRAHVDFMRGLSSLGMENTFKRGVKELYKTAFNSFAARVNEGYLSKDKGLDAFQRKFSFYYWTAGMVVTIERVAPMKMVVGSRAQTYKVPVELDILDPLRIDLDQLYDQNAVYYELKDTEVKSITTLGVKAPFLAIYDDKVRVAKPSKDDPNPTMLYAKQDIVNLVVQQKQTSVPLPYGKVRIYRNTIDDTSVYPIPPITAALVALADKAMLREADRSVMSKIINMLLLYQVGQYNADGKPTNVGDRLLQIVQGSFLSNIQQRGKDGRVMIQVVPDTHKLAWIVPDTKDLLNQDKYHTVNVEVYASLVGPAAWQILSTRASTDNDVFFRLAWTAHEMFLNIYRRFIESIYADIVTWNNMKFDPTMVNLKSKRITILDTDAFATMRSNLADKGQLSVKSMLEDAGEDFDAIVEELIEEKALTQEFGIFTALPTFTQTTVSPDGATQTDSGQPSPGRPKGVKETAPRAAPDPGAAPDGAPPA